MNVPMPARIRLNKAGTTHGPVYKKGETISKSGGARIGWVGKDGKVTA